MQYLGFVDCKRSLVIPPNSDMERQKHRVRHFAPSLRPDQISLFESAVTH
jgi:hypothetical protein